MATTFVLLFSGGGMPEGEEETKRVMSAWDAWMGKYHDAITDPGNPFTPAAKTIRADGTVSDGSAIAASGYVVIKADSSDQATAIAKECPVLLGGATISLFETFDVMAPAGASASEHQH